MPKIPFVLRRVAALAALAAVGLVGYLGALQLDGNFGTVVPGQVYRSAQPTPARLDEFARAYGIKAVLNLRGGAPGAAWYDRERDETGKLGLTLIDFPMSDHEVLSQARTETLLSILRSAPKPLLIHCKAGSDRTGLASAIYLGLVAGRSEHVAEDQLSIRYGHLSVPDLSRAWPMDITWENIERSGRILLR